MDMDPTRSSPPAKPNLREIDVEDLRYLKRLIFSKPSDDSVADVNKCGGPAKPAEVLRMKFLEESIREVGVPARTSEEQLKGMNAVLFRMFLEEMEPQTTTDETDDDDSDEELGPCEVCMKDEGHLSDDCPYLVAVPDPDNMPVGKGYMIVCNHCCLKNHGRPAGTWPGRAAVDLFETSYFLRQPTGKSDGGLRQPTDKSDDGDGDVDVDEDGIDWSDSDA